MIIGWFQVLDGTGNTPELVLRPSVSAHQGHYICRVHHGGNFTFSRWAHVRFVQAAGASPGNTSLPSFSAPVYLVLLFLV